MNPNVSLSFVATTDAAAAEKAICITPVDQDHLPGSGGYNVIEGQINLTPGATTTAVVLKLRQGSGVAGTTVKTLTHTLAAAATGNIAFHIIDTAPVAGGQYTLTVTQTGGSGAGTVNDAVLMVTGYPQG